MRTTLSNKRRNAADLLVIKAGQIWNSIYGENMNLVEWNRFTTNLYRTAKKSNKAEWLYNCQEMVLNLTR